MSEPSQGYSPDTRRSTNFPTFSPCTRIGREHRWQRDLQGHAWFIGSGTRARCFNTVLSHFVYYLSHELWAVKNAIAIERGVGGQTKNGNSATATARQLAAKFNYGPNSHANQQPWAATRGQGSISGGMAKWRGNETEPLFAHKLFVVMSIMCAASADAATGSHRQAAIDIFFATATACRVSMGINTRNKKIETPKHRNFPWRFSRATALPFFFFCSSNPCKHPFLTCVHNFCFY